MIYPTDTIRRAEQILGYGITSIAGERTYTLIDDTIYTDLYTGEVVIPGYTGTVRRAFNGKINGTEYFNEIILVDKCKDGTEYTLDFSWGSEQFMTDVDSLLEFLSSQGLADGLENANVKRKDIEDFSVTLNDSEQTAKNELYELHKNFGFYIRKPLIVGFSSEQKNAHRYF